MAQDNQGSGTMLLGMVIAVVIAFAGGYMLGSNSQSTSGASPEAAMDAQGGAAAPSAGIAGDSDKIPVGNSYVLGKADAPITVVEFSDFQCPYCSRGGATVKQLQQKYPNDVKVVFKHFPLAFHQEAKGASIAALAAGEQGKFWEMHDILFQNQKAYKGADMKELTSGYAKQLGLDVNKFMKDYDNPKFGQMVDADMKLGSSLGVRGTPHFFINGERLSGAQPIDKFEEIVKKQLGTAKQLLAAGTSKKDLYAKMVATNFKAAEAPAAKKQAPQGQVVQMVPVRPNSTALKGEKNNFLITIVEFSDFQCPFCTRVNPTIDQIMKKYGKDTRVIFKQNPLPFHKEADMASQAALAAGEQGKFWEMHDLLFENQKAFKGADMKELTTGYAQQLGLNVNKFKAYIESGKGAAIVKEDLALGQKVGARGTPNFFVNGIQVVGAKPFAEFDTIITKQLEVAKKLQKEKNLKGEELYAAVVAFNKANAPAAPAAPAQPAQKIDPKKLTQGNSYVKGPKDAKVTIYEFSDFQCPYCSRADASIQEVLKAYPKDVKVVFKAFPLPFHKEAEPAHRAALAAGKQGKFWEMHDKFFANQKALKTPDIWNTYAQELGLNMGKFKADMESAELKKQVQDEMALGKSVGVRGTPAFFVNGNRIVGAQPFAKFKELIDAELK